MCRNVFNFLMLMKATPRDVHVQNGNNNNNDRQILVKRFKHSKDTNALAIAGLKLTTMLQHYIGILEGQDCQIHLLNFTSSSGKKEINILLCLFFAQILSGPALIQVLSCVQNVQVSIETQDHIYQEYAHYNWMSGRKLYICFSKPVLPLIQRPRVFQNIMQ